MSTGGCWLSGRVNTSVGGHSQAATIVVVVVPRSLLRTVSIKMAVEVDVHLRGAPLRF